jgi:hypothetical protein
MNKNIEKLINSFDNIEKELNAQKKIKDSYLKYFQEKEYSIGAPNKDGKQLNKLYKPAENKSGKVLVINQYDTSYIFNNTHNQDKKFKKKADNYIKYLKKDLEKHTKQTNTEQEARKTKLDIEKQIPDLIEKINKNFNVIDEKFTQSTNDIASCMHSLKFEAVAKAIYDACNKIVLDNIDNNKKDIKSKLVDIKKDTSSAIAKYLVGNFEYSAKLINILNIKNHFKALEALNKEVIKNFSDRNAVEKMADEGEGTELKVFGMILDLQINIADVLNSTKKGAITEHSENPKEGDYNFSLEYSKYFNEIEKYSKDSFKENFETMVDNEYFKQLEIFDRVKKDLSAELNKFCPGYISSGTEEDQMYCAFKDLLNDIVQNDVLHQDL